MAATSKTARLEARITGDQKDLIVKAASLSGKSMTEFVVSSAVEIAGRTIREHETISLTAHDQEVFVAALLNPPAPGPRLRKAAARHNR